MRKIHLAVLLLAALALGGSLQAQEKLSIDKVYSVRLRNSGPIIENEQIKGYFLFYLSDKIDRKTNEYTLQILDANLNKIKDIKFADSKKLILLESAFNGNSIVFTFYDNDQNLLDYRMYKTDGKQSFTYSKTLDKKSEAYLAEMLKFSSDEDSENQTIHDLTGKGFLAVVPVRDGKKFTYEVNFYATEKRRTWTYNPVVDEKFTMAQFLGANDSIAFLEVGKRERLMSREADVFIVGINLHNGRQAFEVQTIHKGTKLLPMNISLLNGRNEFMIMGPYYTDGDRVAQDRSAGLGIWLMNNKGQILATKYNSWTNEIGKFVKTDQKGRVEDMGYVFFHDIVQTEDGKIFAIGEGYKKVANAAGIAMTALSGSYNSNVTKMKITDMLLIQLNDKFEVADAKIYDKFNNSYGIPGTDIHTPHTMALVLKSYGAFDYSYTQAGKNKATFTSGYTDYEKTKDYKGLTFNSISYADGAVTTDKINLKSSASRLRVMPGKPGSVLIMEYFKKDKRLDLRMEKLN